MIIFLFAILVVLLFFVVLLHIYSKNKKNKMDNKKQKREHVNHDTLSGESSKRSFRERVMGFIDGYAFALCWYLGRIVSLIPSHIIRVSYFRFCMNLRVSRGATIYGGSELIAPWGITLGRNSIIGIENKIDGRYGVVIGANVNMSHGVCIWTEQHDVNSVKFVGKGAPVVVGDRVWLSCRCIILPGVHVGEGAVVAAGAVVTSDVEPYTIVGGIPARKIGDRSRNLDYEL